MSLVPRILIEQAIARVADVQDDVVEHLAYDHAKSRWLLKNQPMSKKDQDALKRLVLDVEQLADDLRFAMGFMQ
jgi:hypothetical protein